MMVCKSIIKFVWNSPEKAQILYIVSENRPNRSFAMRIRRDSFADVHWYIRKKSYFTPHRWIIILYAPCRIFFGNGLNHKPPRTPYSIFRSLMNTMINVHETIAVGRDLIELRFVNRGACVVTIILYYINMVWDLSGSRTQRLYVTTAVAQELLYDCVVVL